MGQQIKPSPEQSVFAEKAIEAMVDTFGIKPEDLRVMGIGEEAGGKVSADSRGAGFIVAYCGKEKDLDMSKLDPSENGNVSPVVIMVGADEEKGIEGWATPVELNQFDGHSALVPIVKIPYEI